MEKPIEEATQLKNLRGIGLLELLLVLSVLGVIVLMSVQYFSSANAQQNTTTLVNSYNTIRTATQNYISDHPAAAFPSMTTLVQQGYLPSSYAIQGDKGLTPAPNQWGGSVAIAGSSSGTFSITETNIPATVCTMAKGQLQRTVNTTLGESVSVSSTGTSDQGTTSCSDGATIVVNYNQ